MFNKSEILRRAWADVKSRPEWKKYRLLRLKFALRDAWAAAKRAAREATQTAADKIRESILILECKDRWTRADYAAANDLQALLRKAEATPRAA